MKFMLKPRLLKNQHGYQSIGLEEPIAQTTFNHPLSLLQKQYDPPRVPRKSV
jgi:protoheme ferro-lyase